MRLGSRSEKDPGYLSNRNQGILQGPDEETKHLQRCGWHERIQDEMVHSLRVDDRGQNCLEALGSNGSKWISEPNKSRGDLVTAVVSVEGHNHSG